MSDTLKYMKNHVVYPTTYSKSVSFVCKQSLLFLLEVFASKKMVSKELIHILGTNRKKEYTFTTPFGVFTANSIDAWRRMYPGYEQEIRDRLHMHHDTRMHNGKTTCINIWANIGRWSIELAKLWYDVISFEPVPHTYDMLKKNIQHSQVHDKVHAYNTALWNYTWTAIMDTFSFHEWANCIDNVRHAYPDSTSTSVEVSVQKFDDIKDISPAEKSKTWLLLIDVEYYEYFVLQWMQDFLTNSDVDIFIEIAEKSLHYHDTIDFLQSCGYSIYEKLWSTNNRHFSKS